MDNDRDKLTSQDEQPSKGKGKAVLSFFLHPPVWFFVICIFATIAVIAATIVILVLDYGNELWANAVYVVAAAMLAYTIYCIVRTAPKLKESVWHTLHKNKYTGAFVEDYALRTIVFAVIAFVINVAYVVVNGVTAVLYMSVWYFCMTAYYLALGLLRGGILYFGHKIRIRHKGDEKVLEAKKSGMYLGCGIAILVSEVALVFAVTQIVMDKQRAETGMILAIAMAAYTFYKFTLAIVNIVKSERLKDETVQCIRNINLVDALVSMLSLEMTLIAATGGKDMTVMSAATGGAVCLITAALGVIMIANGAKRLKNINERQQ